MPNCWMVRAERKSQYLEDFLEKNVVTIGCAKAGDITGLTEKSVILERIESAFPDWKPGKREVWANQLYKFVNVLAIGDKVLSYDTQARKYHIGTITGQCQHSPEIVGRHASYRSVKWQGSVPRDILSTPTKNSLGAISSLFRVPDVAANEILAALKGEPQQQSEVVENDEESEEQILENLEERALEFTKDRINRLGWEEMQELVAGILRAMGYKTRVSPSGPDRGKDIIASPDGFGFENPRIVVEVKHRVSSAMGAQEIRSFLGGRHNDDKGLYVSTGGFTKDAYYEAERASIPLTLMNLDDLVWALLENYEDLDVETKQLIPLKRVFWPV